VGGSGVWGGEKTEKEIEKPTGGTNTSLPGSPVLCTLNRV